MALVLKSALSGPAVNVTFGTDVDNVHGCRHLGVEDTQRPGGEADGGRGEIHPDLTSATDGNGRVGGAGSDAGAYRKGSVDRQRCLVQLERGRGVIGQSNLSRAVGSSYRRGGERQRTRREGYGAGAGPGHTNDLRAARVAVIDDQRALLRAVGFRLESNADGALRAARQGTAGRGTSVGSDNEVRVIHGFMHALVASSPSPQSDLLSLPAMVVIAPPTGN